jgi:hypothetical protein
VSNVETHVDGSELLTLARDLGKLSSPLVVEAVTKAVGQSAARVQGAWNRRLPAEGAARLTSRAITYDVGTARQFALFQTDVLSGPDEATIVAEIGAKRGSHRQAGVVRLLENGSAHNPPHGYGAASLFENEADFDASIDFAIWAVERAAGL